LHEYKTLIAVRVGPISCKFIKNDEADEAKKKTGINCSTCKKGDISERRGRFGIFYSCSN
jgi:ssDNA-binding Zn-finger/Zn-ribbon topoisomerase 1